MRALLLVLFFFTTLSATYCQSVDRYTIIPRPAQLDPRTGEFIIDRSTVIMVPFAQTELKAIADTFATQLNRSTGLNVPVRNTNKLISSGNIIEFSPSTDTTLHEEGYRINVTDRLAMIEARSSKGFFYAVQTLYQLLPPVVLSSEQGARRRESLPPNSSPALRSMLLALPIPACRIQDSPRYGYRGLHLDVSRHFFSVTYIKKYLDLMALHKLNQFHWHLTDDQGWRIEIKKYPKLTQVGAHRRETIVGHYDDHDPQVFDGKPYSGFYTQDEIREVVRYAATKYINVVPEIELPGHALAALASYPELGCTPGPYTVSTKWGVFDDVFCPTEKTFSFLGDVLTEVIDLFPGKYIHIGGDECPKVVWRKSAFCQQLIKRLRLRNENGLQSYFVKRIDKFVTSKGRRIIGWDEILQGGLSPNATVMSWRSIRGGIEAARQHHDVIMTPGQFCYFDHFQGDPAQEPTGFGSYLPLDKVYNYNPTPAELAPAEAAYILGVQGNIWTEYISTHTQLEYMLWPRAAALAEVAWTPLAQKNYDDFTRRLAVHFNRLTNLNTNYSRTLYDVALAGKPTAEGNVEVSLSAGKFITDIRYSLDGSIPTGESPRYEKPILLQKSTTLRVASFQEGQPLSQPAKVQKEFIVSKATGKPYTLLNAPTAGRPDRNYSLTDGTTCGMGGYEVAGIVAFSNDLNAVIDLGQPQSVETVRVGFLKYTARNICLPKQVDVSVSEDGKTYRPVLTTKTNAAEGGKRGIVRIPFSFEQTTARYVRIIAHSVGRVPAGLRNPGRTAQLAVDEIEVN
ncbi:family 20 glycosylhydrolase [Spirosoma sp. BT702]|uniref:beta-N-acetylhexosaminidase n=1 Tax=Spirosoma profusum TaxID=2771354 RepID=A0A926XV71_9BACT|nr:family 20 glycosylhydrolase [Spirosoma profusum]MBD2701194.1 family 20 glycosylhydrolase [Spirosoma profusum]